LISQESGTAPGRSGGLDDAESLDVIGLGALNVDLIATGSDLDDEVEDGETVTTLREILDRLRAENLVPATFLGGSAFNAMVMLAQLRLDLQLGMAGISAAAPDHCAESHSDRLEALHIRDFTRRSQHGPGVCLAFSTWSGRSLHTAPEANLEIAEHLRSNDRLRTAAKAARVLHLTSLLEDPSLPGSTDVVEVVASFVETAKTDNPDLLLSFDPGTTWVDGLERLPDLRRIYALADVLYINPQELAVLNRASGDRSGRMSSLLGLCPPSAFVVVKPMDEIVVQHADGFEVTRVLRCDETIAVDPTGAGDAVAAGVLAALGQGRTVAEGCALGLRVAARRVSEFGDRGHANLRDALGDLWRSEPSLAH
jgi:sugar/nucleoside kinase (ribokinase family)